MLWSKNKQQLNATLLRKEDAIFQLKLHFKDQTWHQINTTILWKKDVAIISLWMKWMPSVKTLAYFICSLENFQKFLCRYFLLKLKLYVYFLWKCFQIQNFVNNIRMVVLDIFLAFTKFWIWKHFHEKYT